jgi:adenine-specific DNA-methyltransferase
MASLAKTYDAQKLLGQVYTPAFLVEKILDDVGFTGSHILGKTILDPACGDGRFLVEVARRIVQQSHSEDLEKNLSCIYGWDIDAEAVELCKKNLNAVTRQNRINVRWNIKVCNAIHQNKKTDLFTVDAATEQFDFIVGNPPYIRIQHLDETERKFIQRHYHFCKSGSTDIFIAFFELAYHLLKPEGICGFITPNTFLYTETAKACRDFFASNGCIKQITNYGDIQLFENATTYSSITIFTLQPNKAFEFQKATGQKKFTSVAILTEELKSQKIWRLSTSEKETSIGKRLGDICQISVGITTLCDKAYIFPIEDAGKKYVWAKTKLKGRIKLEKAILKPVVKGSKLKSSNDPIREWLLFPYLNENGKHRILPESELKKKFPLAYRYLLSVKDELDKRDNGRPNSVAWYAFGRSQSLNSGFGRKIIFSPMNQTPNFIRYDNEACTVYSGYFIKYNGDAQSLMNALNSEAMKKFVAVSSRDFRGAWKAYSKKAIEDFVVNLD